MVFLIQIISYRIPLIHTDSGLVFDVFALKKPLPTDVAFGKPIDDFFMIDNLVVFGTKSPTDAVEPIAAILPTFTGATRNFGLAMSSKTDDQEIHNQAAPSIYPDGPIHNQYGISPPLTNLDNGVGIHFS